MNSMIKPSNGIFLYLGIVLIALSACQKSPELAPEKLAGVQQSILSTLPPPPVANGQGVSVSVNQTQPGFTIADNFAGLSYETNYIARDPSFLRADNAVLLQMIQNLGANGVIRIGGGSSDETIWTGGPRYSNTGIDSLTTTDINQLAAFVSATGGWKLIFGLNMGHYNPSLNAKEAVYVSNALGANLYALQFGNEPASLSESGLRPPGYDVNGYMADWSVYRDSVRNRLPLAPLAGPDVSKMTNSISVFLKPFADNLHADIKLLSGHYYGNGYSPVVATDPESVFDSITSIKTYKTTPVQLGKINTLATSYSLPYRITECGSVSKGGVAGISDAFGSALWALDFMWQVAVNNGRGVDFHGSATSNYTPIARTNGAIVPRPTYYAMLAFKYGGGSGSQILPATLTANGKLCTAYACIKNGKTYVTMVNRDQSDLSYTVNLSNAATQMTLYRLTAASIAAKTGITFGGATVSASGTFSTGAGEQYAVGANTAVVNVPARTAVVVVFE